MGRRIFAGLIALASTGHMIVLVMGVALGWFPMDGSILLLSTAFVLALLALAASLWVLRSEDTREWAQLAEQFFECRECGHHRNMELGFCTACGAHA